MREIKFRAWNKNLNNNGGMIWNVAVLNGKYFDPFEMETQEYPLMQYTGLTDKNDVEIYEGDIFKYISEDGDGDIGVVKMCNNGFWIVEIKEIEDFDPLCDWLDGNIKILGNIYENIELTDREL